MKNYCLCLLITVALCAGCTGSPFPIPTSTSLPTTTPAPSPTAPAIKTQTPIFDENKITVLVMVKNFSIEVPISFLSDQGETGVSIADESGSLVISFAGNDQYDDKSSMEVVIKQYLDGLRKKGADLQMGIPEKVEVDGSTGTAANVSGTMAGHEVEGRAVAVTPHADFVLFGFAIAKLDPDPQKWVVEGSSTFEDLIASIKFLDPSGVCVVSSDETYGYKPENPIKVGGGDFGGPSRERVYLDNLRTPNGDEITYTRNGSTFANDVIIDTYTVVGPGMEVTLYIDEYNFADPLAPVGFTCAGPFPLEEP